MQSGLNLDVENTKCLFIVNFGGATTELSIIAGGGLVLNQLLKVGGSDLDQAVAQLVRYNHDFLIVIRQRRRFAEILVYSVMMIMQL